MVVSMVLDAKGTVTEAQVRAALIHSKMRLTYEQVAAELSGTRKLPARIHERLVTLRAAADRLRAHRLRRGAVELNLPESKIVLDEDDPSRIRRIYSARASMEIARAYNLIEEFMVAANEAVARIAARHKLPVIYRVHDRPEEKRLEKFAAVAQHLGAPVDPEQLTTPRGVRKFLARHVNHPRRDALHTMLLRAMAQAEYDTVNIGHFALAASHYLHFTSPIRRYPDLVSHRVIKTWLASKGAPAGPNPPRHLPRLKDVQAHAVHASGRERESSGAEYDTKSLFAAAYMRDRIGDRFEGMVTGVASSGVFVMLDDPFVDGMVRRAQLERDYRESWQMDDLGIRMTATRSGMSLALGDRVVVEVEDASMSRRQVDLAFVTKLHEPSDAPAATRAAPTRKQKTKQGRRRR